MVRRNRKEKLWFDCGRLHEDLRWELIKTLGLPCSSLPSVSEQCSKGQRPVWQVHAVETVILKTISDVRLTCFYVVRLGLPQG